MGLLGYAPLREALTSGERQKVLERLCNLVNKVWWRIDPTGSTASDCFCHHTGLDYRNEGKALDFIEEAVDAALAARAAT